MTARTRKTIYVASMWLLVYGSIEVLSGIGYRFATGRMFGFADVQEARSRVREELPTPLVDAPERGPVPHWQVVHPYLGFVLHPSPREESSNEYGFIGTLPPLALGSLEGSPADAERAVVAVVGGSVAQRMAHEASDELARELAGAACFGDRKIVVANLALPGFKQPQQLLTLEYFLSIGAAIDVLISLDGFNEVALPVAENLEQGVNPFYPRNWKFHVAGLYDIPTLRRIGAVEFWRETRKALATTFSAGPLRYSVSANTLWVLVDRAIHRHVTMGMLDITLSQSDASQNVGGYMKSGPERSYATEALHYKDLVAVWERSIHLMHLASRAAGISSFHFLQPNQRVPNSKPFSDEERRIALPRRQAYDEPARKGYPELIAGAARMAAAGVPFYDLTMIFADTPEPVYNDGCCHVNTRGSRLLAREIAQRIVARFEAGVACPRFARVGTRSSP